MAYSLRSQTPFISTRPLSYKKAESADAKEIRTFMKTHNLLLSVDSEGKTVIKAERSSFENDYF